MPRSRQKIQRCIQVESAFQVPVISDAPAAMQIHGYVCHTNGQYAPIVVSHRTSRWKRQGTSSHHGITLAFSRRQNDLLAHGATLQDHLLVVNRLTRLLISLGTNISARAHQHSKKSKNCRSAFQGMEGLG